MSFEAPHFDDSPEDSEPLLPAVGERPLIEFELADKIYNLTWENTIVREFTVGDGEFDHVIHKFSEDGGGWYIFFNDNRAGQELKDLLEKRNFPREIRPMLNQQTIDWYAETRALQLGDTVPDSLF